MSDFKTTLTLDDDGFDKGLRAAIRKEERYARELKRINRTLGDDAAREFDRIARKHKMLDRDQRGLTGRMRGMGRTGAKAFGSIARGAGVAGAAVAGITAAAVGSAVAVRKLEQRSAAYADRWDFASRRLREHRREVDLLANSFDRLGAGFTQSNFAREGTRALTAFGDRFVETMIGGDAFRDLQVRELEERARRGADARSLLEADRLAATGNTADAQLRRAAVETNARLRAIDADATLTYHERKLQRARLVEGFDRMKSRSAGVDRANKIARSLLLDADRLDDGTISGRFAAQRFRVMSQDQRSMASLFGADLGEAERAEAQRVLGIQTERRLEQLELEETKTRRLLRIERERVALLARERGVPTRATSLRAARLGLDAAIAEAGTILDPEERRLARRRALAAYAGEAFEINRDFNGRERNANRLVQDAELAKMDQFGRSNAADRIRARRQFEDNRRSIERSLGAQAAAPIIRKLELELERTLAMIGARMGRTLGVADPRLGGFSGITARLGVNPETRILEEIARNTRGAVVLKVR